MSIVEFNQMLVNNAEFLKPFAITSHPARAIKLAADMPAKPAPITIAFFFMRGY